MIESKPKSKASLVRRPLLAAALAATATVPAPALAAVDAYLKLDNVSGESSDSKHQDWIEVLSLSSGFEVQTVNGNPGLGKPVCKPFVITKPVDKASPILMAAAATGQHFQKASLEFLRTSGRGETYMKYDLQNVFVTSMQQDTAAGSEGPVPTESISFNYSKLDVSFAPQNSDGSPGSPVSSSLGCL